MFLTIKKQTRSSIEIPFFFELDNSKFNAYLKEKYSITGKILGSKKEFSEDKLQVIHTTTWNSYDDFKCFISDTVCLEGLILPNKNYDIENRITADNEYIWGDI